MLRVVVGVIRAEDKAIGHLCIPGTTSDAARFLTQVAETTLWASPAQNHAAVTAAAVGYRVTEVEYLVRLEPACRAPAQRGLAPIFIFIPWLPRGIRRPGAVVVAVRGTTRRHIASSFRAILPWQR